MIEKHEKEEKAKRNSDNDLPFTKKDSTSLPSLHFTGMQVRGRRLGARGWSSFRAQIEAKAILENCANMW